MFEKVLRKNMNCGKNFTAKEGKYTLMVYFRKDECYDLTQKRYDFVIIDEDNYKKVEMLNVPYCTVLINGCGFKG